VSILSEVRGFKYAILWRNNKTSVFLDRDLSHAEAQRHGVCVGRKERIDRKDWKCVKLGDVLKVCHGKCQHSIESKTGKYPILATSGEIGRTDQFLYDKPSVLIGRKGTIDKPQYINTPFWTIDTLFYTKVADGYSPKFMFYLCKMIDWASLNEASGVPSLSANRIESLEVCVPQDLDKQLRIVKSLDAVESHINALRALISKYDAIKKATVNLLLTPSDGWKQQKLSDVATTSSGGTPSRGNSNFFNGNIPWFTTGELNDGLLLDSVEHISEEAMNNSSAKIYLTGTILLAMYGATIGKLGVLGVDAASNQACCAIRCGENLVPAFLFHLLYHMRDELIAKGCGAGQPNISQQIVRNLTISIPSIDKQRKIAAQISAIDNVLKDCHKQLVKAQSLKQGMMSYFFG